MITLPEDAMRHRPGLAIGKWRPLKLGHAGLPCDELGMIALDPPQSLRVEILGQRQDHDQTVAGPEDLHLDDAMTMLRLDDRSRRPVDAVRIVIGGDRRGIGGEVHDADHRCVPIAQPFMP